MDINKANEATNDQGLTYEQYEHLCCLLGLKPDTREELSAADVDVGARSRPECRLGRDF